MCLGHGIITRGRSVLHTNRKAFDTCVISIGVIIQFQVQFGINLHEWVFQKAEIALAEAFSFLKNSQVQINSKLNEKNCMITY